MESACPPTPALISVSSSASSHSLKMCAFNRLETQKDDRWSLVGLGHDERIGPTCSHAQAQNATGLRM